MGEFSAHRVTLSAGERVVIATPVNLYVSPYGDDALNSGIEEGSPFQTPGRAIEWLGDKYISDSGFVTINFAAGIYDLDDQIVLDHEQGNRIAFIGAEPEILLLSYVSDYITSGFTANGYFKYYSGVTHGITLACLRPDDNTVFAPITSANAISAQAGSGVIIEDFELAHTDNYNPAYYYGSYPFNPRNNLVKQGSILGSHVLMGVSANGALLNIKSTIRDDWFSIPQGNSASWGRMFGNAQAGICYYSGLCANNPADFTETETNTWFQGANTASSVSFRSHYLSSVPAGYYGTNATTGITNGSTGNLVGASFPNGSTYGSTASFNYRSTYGGSNVLGWYTGTGPAGSFLNDMSKFGNNYHEHASVNGRNGIGSSGSWKSVNSNRITVKIVPTVFRRFGNLMRIGSGGLRKIKNIFFDGIDMPSHYKLLGNSETGYSNKCGVYAVNARIGETVINEPLNSDFGPGLFSNCGMKDFQVGFYADRGTDAYLGKLVVSNCSYGILANNRSSISTVGSVCTGMASTGFGAFTSSSIVADRCFASFVGQSHVSIRLKEVPSGTTLDDYSYIPGQTFATPDGRVKGTIWDWDPRDKTLVIAVRAGMFEAADAVLQG